MGSRAGVVSGLGPLIVGALFALPAQAQLGDDEARQAAAALMDQGNGHYAAQRYEQAIRAYSDAYQRYPSPKILLNLAQAESANGRADYAAAHYEQFLASPQVDATDPQRDNAKLRLEDLSRSLGRVVFEDGQPGTGYRLDASPLAPLPEAHLWVVPGRHQLAIEREGEQSLEIEIEVSAGQKLPVRARLAPIPAPPPIAVAPPPKAPALVAPAPEPEGSIATKWWFWVGAAALIGGAVAIGVVASQGGDEFVPGGELGRFETTGWDRAPGG